MMALLRDCGSKHIWTLPSFFWATTTLDTHGVGSVTAGAIICFSTIASSSLLTILRSETGNRRGGLTTGTELGWIWIVYSPGSSPSPVNTSLNWWRTGVEYPVCLPLTSVSYTNSSLTYHISSSLLAWLSLSDSGLGFLGSFVKNVTFIDHMSDRRTSIFEFLQNFSNYQPVLHLKEQRLQISLGLSCLLRLVNVPLVWAVLLCWSVMLSHNMFNHVWTVSIFCPSE